MEDWESMLLLFLGFVAWAFLLLVGLLANLSRSSPWWVVLTLVYAAVAIWLYALAEKNRLGRFSFSLRSPYSRRQMPSWKRFTHAVLTVAHQMCFAPLIRIFHRQANAVDLVVLLGAWLATSQVAFRMVSISIQSSCFFLKAAHCLILDSEQPSCFMLPAKFSLVGTRTDAAVLRRFRRGPRSHVSRSQRDAL
jgi:hypothetical protein